MKNSELRFNLDGLEDLHKKMGRTYRARVGVLGSDVNRKAGTGSITNGELLLIQMFGSVTRGIPPRDPLIMPLERNKQELVRSMAAASVRTAIESGDYRKAFMILGRNAYEFVQKAFETSGFGTWPPNAESTIARKGSSRPLIDTGELRKAITFDVVGDSTGVKRGFAS